MEETCAGAVKWAGVVGGASLPQRLHCIHVGYWVTSQTKSIMCVWCAQIFNGAQIILVVLGKLRKCSLPRGLTWKHDNLWKEKHGKFWTWINGYMKYEADQILAPSFRFSKLNVIHSAKLFC